MIKTNLLGTTNSRVVISQKGMFSVVEYLRDISVSPEMAQTAYFASEMNVRKRQLIATLDGKCGVIAQSGTMQLMVGQVEADSNVHGDLLQKFAHSLVTKETIIKPRYYGVGNLVLEPTFKYIILLDLGEWQGNIVIEDGMFLACEESVFLELDRRKNISSLAFGKEGIFNTRLEGTGVVALESPIPEEELIVIDLVDDTLKIDGDMAIAWSDTLDFSVQKATKTLIGSLASGEGLVNVYEGTGRVLIAPVRKNKGISTPAEGGK